MIREFTRKITNLLMGMRPGHLYGLIVIVAVVISELICLVLGLVLTGRPQPLLIWGGLITPFIDAIVIGYFVIYLISELRNARQDLERRVEERNLELLVKNRELEKEIDERKQVEKEVRRINEDLDRRVRERTEDLKKAYEGVKKADELKDSFLSSVSHELRTPLTSIRSFAEILLQYEDEAPETRKEFLGIIHVESERLARLINDFLDLSKINAGKMVYNDEPVSVEEIIRDVTKSQQQLFRKKSLRMNLDIDPDLPPVFADRDRVQQVITNLLANAVKFSLPGGEVRVEVEVLKGKRAGEPPGWVKVSISDQGIGIEEKHFEMIFDKFRQVSEDTLEDKPSGTGLGLPICKEIISYYGGNIWVESRKGRGSTFSLTLPTADFSAQARWEAVPTAKTAAG
ncbi:MAG: ATP-binding protein [Thermodesulfobacteriota bacterium]